MKRVVLFFLTGVLSLLTVRGALAFSPDQYALQVLQKDVPRSLRWFSKAAQSEELSQLEVYELYQSALPESQANEQLGISAKGSVERLLLLLEGARYFEQVQKAPLDFQNKKEVVNRTLQVAKDEMDRFQYGEDPQNLIEEWRIQAFQLYGMDFAKFSADMVETFVEVQKLLSAPVMVDVEQRVDAQVQNEDPNEHSDEDPAEVEVVHTEIFSEAPVAVATSALIEEPPLVEESFETQRLKSYVDSAEAGRVAGECLSAQVWQTDQAASCQSDDTVECDRSYARQCKKLQ